MIMQKKVAHCLFPITSLPITSPAITSEKKIDNTLPDQSYTDGLQS